MNGAPETLYPPWWGEASNAVARPDHLPQRGWGVQESNGVGQVGDDSGYTQPGMQKKPQPLLCTVRGG